MTDPTQQALQQRGLGAVLMLAVPIASILLVALGYLVLLGYGQEGRNAQGPLAQVRFEACPEAQPLLEARTAVMGLEDATWSQEGSQLVLKARLPNQERVLEALPGTLARQGRFEARAGSDGTSILTHDALDTATVVLPFLDAPYAHVTLKKEGAKALAVWMQENPTDAIDLFVDGVRVSSKRNSKPITDGEIQLDASDLPVLEGTPLPSDLERIDFAAETALILDNGPLPCDVRVADVAFLDEGLAPIEATPEAN